MFTLFSTLIALATHALAARWALRAFPALARHRRIVVAAVVVLALAPVIARAGLRRGSHDSPLLAFAFAVTMVELCTVALAVIPVTLVSLALRARGARPRASLDAGPAVSGATDPTEGVTNASPEPRFVSVGERAHTGGDEGAAPRARVDERGAPALDTDERASSSPGAEPPREGRRRFVEQLVGASIFAGTGATLGWGALRGRYDYALEEVVVRIPGLSRALDGYTIVQISDVHVGSFVGERELAAGFDVVRRAKPDLLVATGDLVDFRADVVGALARAMADVGARDGAVAALGNHDHYAGAARVERGLAAAGVRVLCNENMIVGPRDGGFALVGVDDLHGRAWPQARWSGPDLSRAVAGLPPELPRVLLAHQPAYFAESAGQVALQLSGHTHGGQINPGFRPIDLLMEFVSGRYERGGSVLWVNRGFGVAGPPSRVGAAPEVTKIVLVGA